jgi:hypothetical protein
MNCDCRLPMFLCPHITLFKVCFYTNSIGCKYFYEAGTTVWLLREYPNPTSKFRVPKFLGIVKLVVISSIKCHNPKFKLPELPNPILLGNMNAPIPNKGCVGFDSGPNT